MSSFSDVQINQGTGGSYMPSDTFTNAATGHTDIVVFSGLAFGALGEGAYTTVSAANGLPVDVVAGSVQVTSLPAIPAGANVIGHVIVDSVGATIAISAASLPLPTGAATAANQTTANTSLASILSELQGTIAVSAASLPLPAGAATSAKQPALGTAGTASTDVLSVQGIASMTPLKVDGSGVTQPVSGTVGVDSLPALASGSANVGYATPAVAGQTTGATPFHLGGSAATVNATSVKDGACTLWDVIAMNVSTSAPAYLKLYDKASAPTVGTDTPVYVLPLPTAGSANGAGAARSWPTGLKFTLGLAYAITGGMADTDATAVAAGQVCLSGSYG